MATLINGKIVGITNYYECPKCGHREPMKADDPNFLLANGEKQNHPCPKCGTEMLPSHGTPVSSKNAIKNAFSKITDFFYEEEPAKKHLEEDEKGNMIEVEDEPKRSINWFKVGACSTSVTLMLIGAIIMLIKKHH